MVELMVALSVAGILLTVALPSYQVFVQDTRLLTQSNHFTSAVMLTKGEAVKRGRSATICPSTDGVACTGGTNWSNGWIVFADEDGDGAVDIGEEVIQVGAPLTGDNQLRSGVRTRVTFAASGFSLGFNDTFSLCDSRGATYSKVLIINNQGRLRAETGTGVCS